MREAGACGLRLTWRIANLLLTIQRNNLACYQRYGGKYLRFKTMAFQQRNSCVMVYNFASSELFSYHDGRKIITILIKHYLCVDK